MKRTVLKRMIVVMLVVVMAIGMIGCSKNSDSSSSSDKKVLKVGMECGYPPFNWTQDTDDNGAVEIGDSGQYAGGYDIEMAKLIADYIGYDLEIVKTEWTGLIPALQSDKINAIIAGMCTTDERKESINFSDTYYKADIVVVTMKDSDYASATNLKDLDGITISSQLGTLWYDLIDQIPNADKATALDSVSAMQVALTSGKIEAYIADLPTALAIQYSDPDVAIIQFADGDGFEVTDGDVNMGIGISKDNEDLLKKVNEALATISEDKRTELMNSAIENQPLAQ